MFNFLLKQNLFNYQSSWKDLKRLSEISVSEGLPVDWEQERQHQEQGCWSKAMINSGWGNLKLINLWRVQFCSVIHQQEPREQWEPLKETVPRTFGQLFRE